MNRISLHTLAAVAAFFLGSAPAQARTIVITDEECERMAFLAPEAPRLGWATHADGGGAFTTKMAAVLRPGRALLIAFPMEKIPKGMRIVQADLVVPINYVSTEAGARLTVRRVLGDWGPGVCHDFRRIRPKKVAWAKPGAAAPGSDCAARATAVLKVTSTGEKTVNVTEDVDLWYGGAAANHGWAFTVEDQNSDLQVLSPISTWPGGLGVWKLRITYEPE